jgi:hypothetical protein
MVLACPSGRCVRGLGTSSSFTWVKYLQINNINFEVEIKRVADDFNSNKVNVLEFGAFIRFFHLF